MTEPVTACICKYVSLYSFKASINTLDRFKGITLSILSIPNQLNTEFTQKYQRIETCWIKLNRPDISGETKI